MRILNALMIVTCVTLGFPAAIVAQGNDPLWPTLRADAAGSGASPRVGKPFRPTPEGLKKGIRDLASKDPAAALRARLYLKRAGADAIPSLKAEMDANGPAAGSCMQILEHLHEP